MKLLKKLLMLLAAFIPTVQSYGQEGTVVIELTFPDSSSKRFQYLDKHNEHRNLVFNNPSARDSVIVQHINIEKPTHFYSLNINFISPDKPPVEDFKSLLVLPGEHLVREKGQFLDQRISMTAEDYDGGKIRERVSAYGFSKTVDTILLDYESRSELIDALNVGEDRRKALSDFNYILFARAMTSVPFDSISADDAEVLNGYYDDILENAGRLENIRSGFKPAVYSALIKRNARRNGATSEDFWEYFDKVDSSISSASFYVPKVQRALKYIEKYEPKRYDALAEKVRSLGIEAIPADQGREQPREYGVIPDQELFKLQTSGKNIVVLADILNGNRGKLMLLDFWASWCIPCRREIPFFEKMKEEFKDKPVEFISISIDLDDKFDAWVKAMKEEKIIDQPNQYRFVDPKNSSFPEFINMQTIPRYVLINDKGEVVNGDFVRPSAGTFIYELNRELERIAKND